MRANLYCIEGPWRGRLAILPRPRGGDWLEDEIRSWRAAGVNVVASTLESDEIDEFDIRQEDQLCERNGIHFVGLPIPDRGVPASARAAENVLRRLESQLADGKMVAVHCRQGVGRSALVAASLLALAGVDVETAFNRVRAARGCPVPDTAEQREWVAKFARDHVAALGGH
jgi:protein-tyrosine phosphatase